MNSFTDIAHLGDAALLVGLSTTRIAVAFALMPVFSQDTVPAMVRNAIFMSMGVLVLALQPAVSPSHWTALHWIGLFGKEACLGLGLAFGIASFLWAFTAAGQLVDTKVGTANAQITDPLSGQQVSPSGALLGRLAGFLFMVGGGFSLFVGSLLESFRAWPLGHLALQPKLAGVLIFERHLGDLMSLTFLLAAPVLVAMFAMDLVLGLVNRYAQQINLSAISASLKGLASTAVWLLTLATLVQGFGNALAGKIAAVMPVMGRLLGAG
ncbi:MAG TPA: type III secretion system export apparatus subunit SctT [Burkholderiaceae bacterium]|nr:type III secretion system export apparatus subunit SctT [Burkholderiaceae bacterium]